MIQPGDIVLTYSGSLLARFIAWGERNRGEGPSRFSHAALVTDGPASDPLNTLIIEAQGRGVMQTWLRVHAKDHIAIYSPENVTDSQRRGIVSYAMSRIGCPYGFGHLVLQLLDHKLLNGRTWFRRLFKVLPFDICSEVVGNAYSQQGLTFGKTPGYAVTPDDIADFCETSGKYALEWEHNAQDKGKPGDKKAEAA